MAKNKFKPLEFHLVDEGHFLADVNEAMAEAMRKLIEHKRKYGCEASKKQKAKVSIGLVFCFDGLDETDFSVRGDVKTTLPGRPARATKAIEIEGDDGESTLFVRATGSTEDTPRQGILTTKDGQIVDPTTGEIKAPASGKSAAVNV